MTQQQAPTGSVTKIEGRWLHGWAYEPAKPTERLRVIILLDGEVAGFATADIYQDELLEDGVGDGGHGFRCELPPAKLNTARLITILAEYHGTFVLIHERAVSQAAAATSQPDRARPAIHFDISDLLEFLSNYREVSGIQRVQCGYLSNALAMADLDFEIRVCAQSAGAYHYVEIAPDRAADLLLAIDGKRALPLGTWREYIAREKQGTGRAPDFHPGDIILTMGAPWVHDNYYAAILTAKSKYGVRYFQIFHDLIPTFMPEVVSIGLIGGFTKSIAGMLQCADHVLANSRYSESDLHKACARIDVACPPTSVIPLGGTIDYRQDDKVPAPPQRSAGPSPRVRYGDFVLCVGTIEPRKNHAYLYHVWKRMLAELGPDIPKLVCIGRKGWHVEELDRYLEVSANLDGHFVHLADVSDSELKRFYQDCLFTVFPSIYEGWGLPVAESLMYRKLCVCSNATSMPEVGGDWVIYIDPHNTNTGFEVIAGLIEDRPRIAAWGRRLQEDYQPLTWRQATAGLLQAIATANAALPPAATQQATPKGKLIQRGTAYDFVSAPTDLSPLAALRAELLSRTTSALLDGPDWHGLENWGCWACGPLAKLSFLLPKSAPASVVCYLSIRLPVYFRTHICHVRINDQHRGSFTLRGGNDHALGLEIDDGYVPCSSKERRVRIVLQLESLVQPEPLSRDQRLLGIGVRALCVCATDDTAERLAYLERNMTWIMREKLTVDHDDGTPPARQV